MSPFTSEAEGSDGSPFSFGDVEESVFVREVAGTLLGPLLGPDGTEAGPEVEANAGTAGDRGVAVPFSGSLPVVKDLSDTPEADR